MTKHSEHSETIMMKLQLIPGVILVAAMSYPVVTPAEGSLLDDLKQGASQAADAVGQAASRAADQVNQTLEQTKADLRNEPTAAQTRAKLDDMSAATLEKLFHDRPRTRELYDASYGYAVFNTRQISMMLAGAYGRGVAINRATDRRTYMKMGSAGVGVGLGVGGFDVQVVIFFETAFGFNQFITQGLDATAEAATITGDEHDDVRLGFHQGRASFVLTKEGWQISARLLGTKYWPDAELNAVPVEAD